MSEDQTGFRPVSGKTVGGIFVLVVVFTGLAAAVLSLVIASSGGNVPAAQLRVDAIKTALTVGAGTGGLIALLISARRQWLSEKQHVLQIATAEQGNFDAGERRITDLYAKAAELLGSDKPAARLAGLYALERLGQENQRHRTTVVNLICGYIRMSSPEAFKDFQAGESGGGMISPEGQVVVTAQRILGDHLRLDDSRCEEFWPGIDLDLSGATLYKFSLSSCQVSSLTFRDVTFLGETDFHQCQVIQEAVFSHVRFEGKCMFTAVVFHAGQLNIEHSTARDEFLLSGTTLPEWAEFRDIVFEDYVSLAGATVENELDIEDCTFAKGLGLTNATIKHALVLRKCKFDGAVLALNIRKVGYTVRFESCYFGDFADLAPCPKLELFDCRCFRDDRRQPVLPSGFTFGKPSSDGSVLIKAPVKDSHRRRSGQSKMACE